MRFVRHSISGMQHFPFQPLHAIYSSRVGENDDGKEEEEEEEDKEIFEHATMEKKPFRRRSTSQLLPTGLGTASSNPYQLVKL